MRGPAIWLSQAQADQTLLELKCTAGYRHWRLHAAAVMANHVHVVLGAPDEVTANKLMQILKSYASRNLNHEFGKPSSETWWTSSGSKRKLPSAKAVHSAMQYVRKQHRPLAMYVAEST